MTTQPTSNLRVGIIGCGHWGKNYVRVFSSYPGVDLTAVADPSAGALASVQKTVPHVRTFASHGDLLGSGLCDAVVVATGASSHYTISREALTRGLHVLTEKPFTLAVEEADELIRLADASRKTLMVAHTFLYNSSVRKIKGYLEEGVLGDVYYLKSRRTHMGLIRHDVNSIWDLAPHDISMFLYFLEEEPEEIQVMGRRVLRTQREDAAFINLAFPSGVIGNIVVSWADSNKERWLDIVGSRARVVFDDLSTLEPVRVFHKGVTADDSQATSFGEFKYLVRDGEIVSPRIDMQEPLKLLCEDFVESVRNGRTPLSDGQLGRKVVSVLCRIDRELRGRKSRR